MVIMITCGPHRDLGTSVLFPKAEKLKWGAFTEDVAMPVAWSFSSRCLFR